jgi:putative peptidoglycan lipid II flippase
MQARPMHRRIITDTFTIGVLIALAKLAGAAKTVIAAHYFGAGDQLDAYFIAFLIPAFIGDVLSGGITQCLLPIFVEVRASSGLAEAQRLYVNVLLASAGLLALVAGLLALFPGIALQLVAGGFSPAKLALTRTLLFVMLPILPLSALSVTWRTLLNAGERFAIAALTTMLTPLMSIVFLVSFGNSRGAYPLALGTVVGALLEAAVLGAAVSASGISLFARPSGFGGSVRRVLVQYWPVASSNIIMGGSSVIDQMMAATLAPGSVSVLNYGTRVASVILAIGPAALGTAILPRLSQMAVGRKWSEFRRTFRAFGILSIAVTIPATAVLIYNSEWLIRILFQRGAFTAADTRVVAGVQAASLLQIPFSVLLVLLVRVIASLQANQLLLSLAVISLISNVVFDIVLMRWYGVAGIALSTAAVHAIALAYAARFTFRRMRQQGLMEVS